MCGLEFCLSPKCSCTPPAGVVDDAIRRRGPDFAGGVSIDVHEGVDAALKAAVLHIRGSACCEQPMVIADDSSPPLHAVEEALAFSGELFAGAAVRADEADTVTFRKVLADCAHDPAALTARLSRLVGPWAFVYWHRATRTLWFGRDPVGRRSLLLHLPTVDRDALVITSVAVPLPRCTCGSTGGAAAAAAHLVAGAVDAGPPVADAATADSPQVDLQSLYPYAEVEPFGLYALRFDAAGDVPTAAGGSAASSAEGALAWTAPAGTCIAGAALRRYDWPLQRPQTVGTAATWTSSSTVAEEPALPFALPHPLPATPDGLPELPDAHVAACSLEMLSRLSAAVRVRVRGIAAAAAPSTCGAAAAVTGGSATVFARGTEPGSVSDAVSSLIASGKITSANELPAVAAAAVFTADAATVPPPARVAVLFSGGLDSMVLAALAHHHVPAGETIDLLNVCFAKTHNSPDRLAALAGVAELRRLFPSRNFQLLLIDESYEHVYANQLHIAKLLTPRLSHMDFNIGGALWCASRGIGYVDVDDGSGTSADASSSHAQPARQLRYARTARLDTTGKGHHLNTFDKRAGAASAATPDAADAHDGDNPHDAVAACASAADVAVALAASAHHGVADDELTSVPLPHGGLEYASLPAAVLDAVGWYLAHVSVDAGGAVASSSGGSGAAPPAGAASFASQPAAEQPPVASAEVAPVAATVATAATPPAATGGAAAAAAAVVTPAPVRSASVSVGGADARPAPGTIQKPCCGIDRGEACTAARSRKCKRNMCKACCVVSTAGPACAVHGMPEMSAPAGADAAAPVAAASGSASAGAVTGPKRVLVRSAARVLLLGIGADEHVAGYARHRTSFGYGAWPRLQAELATDTGRIWQRNLGRDDRVCSDHGREIRLPYLDEGVSAYVRLLPLPFVADLRLPYGVGDKRILRVAARMLGLGASTCLVKRAIHFGSRIAKQSNVASFGSNRAGKGDAPFLFKVTADDAGE